MFVATPTSARWILGGVLAICSGALHAETPKTAAGFAPAVLPGKGLAQHPFLYAGEWDHRYPDQTMFVVRDGKVAWTYTIKLKDEAGQIQEFSDATMLSNGNIAFARKTGAGIVTPQKTLIWNYDAPPGFEVHVAQPIGLERVMLIQNGNPAKAMVINIRTGKAETEFKLSPGNPAATHGQFRRARMTLAGTLLVAHMDNNKVAEYDLDGKEIWAIAVLSPWAAVRLHNGNTLVTSNRGFVREYNSQGEKIWEFTQKDLPEIKLFNFQEANRLANGNTVMSLWCPGELRDPKEWPKSVQVIEVTAKKKLVWALRSWDNPANLGPATCIQLLDQPGKAEDGDQPR
ncbi:MAG: hypothetical protein ABIV50_14205 [Opitutus sp.]